MLPSATLPAVTDFVGIQSFACPIVPDRNADGSVERFCPQARYYKHRTTPLHAYGTGDFCRFRIDPERDGAGVYVMVVAGLPVYVGECQNLKKRFNAGHGQISPRNCFKGGREPNCRINHLILDEAVQGAKIDLIFFPIVDHKRMESRLLATFNWPWNR